MKKEKIYLEICSPYTHPVYTTAKESTQRCLLITTVKPVLNGISRDQNIFPLKPGIRLIKVHYLYKN